MTETKPKKHKTREQQRFEREAGALRKNLEKRKRQQELRQQQKEDDHGQDKD